MVDCDLLIKKLFKNVSRYLDNIFRVHVRAILKTTNNEQENVSSFLGHLDPINVTSTDIEKAPDIFEDFNKNESELFQ